MIFSTCSADKLLGVFTPCDRVEVAGLTADVADVSPVPITSWIVTFRVVFGFT